jgi:acyl-CoA reductase-like NAD-dependent aldehyde dehydrogenase
LQTQVPLIRDKAFVNGAWVPAVSGKVFDVIDPASGKVVGSVPDMDAHDTAKAIQAAADAFQSWKNTTAKVVIKCVLYCVYFKSQQIHISTGYRKRHTSI